MANAVNVFIAPAPAKLNLFLHVVGRRQDGYHLLESLMVLLDFGDTLSFISRHDSAISLHTRLPDVLPEDDLSLRAARVLQETTRCPLGVDISIIKRIPIGGGLGGGSSNAATTLLALNRLWKLHLNRAELMDIGLSLGADVPFFLFGQPAFASGIGEKLQAVSLPPFWFVVLSPPVHASTASVFAQRALTPHMESRKMLALCEGEGKNDLQDAASAQYPAIAEYLTWLNSQDHGGWLGMTGSGSSVFAAFPSEARANRLMEKLPRAMMGLVARSLSHHPLKNYALDQN